MAKTTTAKPSTKQAAQTTSAKTEKSDKPAKQKQGKPAKQDKPGIFTRFGHYLRDVRTELRRTVWPTRDEVIRSSFVVVVTLVFFIVFLLIVDFVVSNAILLISNVGG